MEKLYYSIGEVAELFNVAPTLIRFWEKEFGIIKPRRNTKGNRMFTAEDIETFRVIHHLVKVRRMTIEGAKMQLKTDIQGTSAQTEAIRRLKSVREELLEIKRLL